MPRITFIQHDGTSEELEAEAGLSLMESAVRNGVPGIDADCGGQCACATCHVFIVEHWLDRTGLAEGQEHEMLDMVEERRPNSRLSCQITVSEALDGLVVRLPENQF